VVLVGAVGIEIASLTSKSFRGNGVAPPPHSNWSLLEPSQDKARSALESFRSLGIDTKKMFGPNPKSTPISHLIGTAVVWEAVRPALQSTKESLRR
jgi:hypothetical protein